MAREQRTLQIWDGTLMTCFKSSCNGSGPGSPTSPGLPICLSSCRFPYNAPHCRHAPAHLPAVAAEWILLGGWALSKNPLLPRWGRSRQPEVPLGLRQGVAGPWSPLDLDGTEAGVRRAEQSGEDIGSLRYWVSGPHFREVPDLCLLSGLNSALPCGLSFTSNRPACNTGVDCNHYWASQLIHCSRLLLSICKHMQVTHFIFIPIPGLDVWCGIYVGFMWLFQRGRNIERMKPFPF
jgi:hypothetical protein